MKNRKVEEKEYLTQHKKQGRIIKGIGGFYYVHDIVGKIHECKAKGRFRNDKITPLVGDEVLFYEEQGSYGFIEEILPRKNALVRPAVANIDVMLLVVAAAQPQVDEMLCDKLLIQAEKNGIQTYFCINKVDVEEEVISSLKSQYRAYPIFLTSAKTGEGLQELKGAIRGKCVCLAGQSAVGKSSLLNAIDHSLCLETGGLSKKTMRGKHTTRSAELLYIEELDAYVVDTPGFSMFDISEVEKEELAGLYAEFRPLLGRCRFTGCVHLKEPDCIIKKEVAQGHIAAERYERYVKLMEEKQNTHNMTEKKRRKKT